MGTWDTSLYGNDTTCNVRDTYESIMQREGDDDKAFEELKGIFQDIFGTDEEPLFWYATAETQWKNGILTDNVKKKAVYWIMKELQSPATKGEWKKTLNKLEEKLEHPKKKAKKEKERRRVY